MPVPMKKSRRRGRGLTLIELMIAIALMTILIGVASYIFITSQKIWTRMDRRLQAAAEFRSFGQILEKDLSRFEAVNGPADPIVAMQLKKKTNANGRADELSFVTHGSRNDVDCYALVTYKIDPSGRRVIRERMWLKAAAGKVQNDAADDTVIVHSMGSGFQLQWVDAGGIPGNGNGDPDDAASSSSTADGKRFYGAETPAGSGQYPTPSFPRALKILITVYEAETAAQVKADTTRLSFVREFLVPWNRSS